MLTVQKEVQVGYIDFYIIIFTDTYMWISKSKIRSKLLGDNRKLI